MLGQIGSNLRELIGRLRMTPSSRVLQIAMGYRLSRALQVVAKLGVADLLKDGPKSAEDLATATQTNPDALFRVMRVLAAMGIFAQIGPRKFALTPLSEKLRKDVPGSVRAAVLYLVDDMQWELHKELRYTVQTGEPAFEHVFGKEPFRYFAEHPELAELANQAMGVFSSANGPAVAAAYDFSKFQVLMDVGGGTGTLLAAILKAHPGLRGILFDLPHVVEHARAAGILPPDRVQFEAGDMFESIPGGADAYVFSSVIHDWPDDMACSILDRCRRAMPSTGKLLLVEMVLTPANPGPKFSDLQMLLMGGRERSEEEFRRLLASAGFRLDRIVPTKSRYSIIEGAPLRS